MKFNELPTTDERRRPLELENGVIESVSISIADHGAMTAWLFVRFNGGGCGFGGYKLADADGDNFDKNFAAHFIVRCLNTLGKTKWEDLKGCPMRCLHEGLGGGIVAIGNFLKDEWYCPRLEMKP